MRWDGRRAVASRTPAFGNFGAMAAVTNQSETVEFGRFMVVRRRRELLADGQRVDVGDRAFDTLLALIDAPGAVQTKDDLMRRVWPDRIVEESNLHVQIAALRKALGADRDLIRTVAGRGYQFTGEVRAVAAGPVGPSRMINVPEALSELIGRESELAELETLVSQHRLITLVGAGGIGKTRLALETARRLGPTFPDGVFVTELAPVGRPELIPLTVAASLNVPLVRDVVSTQAIAAAVGTRRLLLVLDNCEHLVDVAARLVETLLGNAPALSVLATSREPLRIPGEHVFRVPSLTVPAEDVLADAEDILRHDSVRLFITRARASEPRFVPDATIASAAGAICRRLDGMPLAIELAAACVGSFGVDGIAVRLDDRFTLLTQGNRTALPRQQTLRATLDWSYDLLSENERLVLLRLSIFTGTFDRDAAADVAGTVGMSRRDVMEALGTLVSKSLITADIGGPVTHYRLLETTRAYALERLRESGEFDGVARRHAEHYIAVCQRTALEPETPRPTDSLTVYGRQVDNVRLALDWAFSPAGDQALGVALTVTAVPLWMHLSLMTECRARLEQALASLESGVPSDPRRDMRLFLALGTALLDTVAVASTDTETIWAKALELATSLDDNEYRLRATYGLCLHRFVNGDYRGALELAECMRAVAATTADPDDVLIARRVAGSILHAMGDQPTAREHVERLVPADFTGHRRLHIVRYHFDQRVVTQCYHARILWLRGFADEALRVVSDVVDYAGAADHVVSHAFALFEAACPIALLAGNLASVERYVTSIRQLSVKHAISAWGVWSQCYEGMFLIRRDKRIAGVRVLRAALDALPAAAFHLHVNWFRGELAEGLAAVGRIVEGLSVIDDAVARADSLGQRWCLPELLRKKGELLLLRDAPADDAAAENCFVNGIEVARRQEALSWELRGALSLARLWHGQGRAAQARNLLRPVYDRFREGLGTSDLIAAKRFLNA